MFTGLIEATGELIEVHALDDGVAWRIRAPQALVHAMKIGDSLAMDGACLTITAATDDVLTVELSRETLARTTFGQLAIGQALNLERAMQLGDRLDGHLVTGHVDAITTVHAIVEHGECWQLRFDMPAALAHLIAEKGSVTINGVSLTVNTVSDEHFEVMLIAHTLAQTNLGRLTPQARVNLEVDLIARYLARMRAVSSI